MLSQAQKTCFYNGKVYTVDTKNSVAEAVVVENGKILFVGSTPRLVLYGQIVEPRWWT
jgi:predicted amidohydrolase YtcJ